ncbi:hypothetical protein [Rathayibacter sp. Leaf296]|uniref:hypothetical protein n=1 Tax=Rathayibacter sp. Leaf296 TaxID=1736327 RepID=UPI000702C01B|nr:hypothetical protein [Rathayibacter sp. Leaf296]KQQ09575.1 nitrate ABC transporter substrate-binding protein [Rathayibacter sp. Leaf296]
MTRRSLRAIALTGAVASLAALTACSGSGAADPSATRDLEIGAVDLAAAGCPATVVVQTDWNPEAEHGHLYEMIGEGHTVDTGLKSVTGPLMASGEYTGVDLEVRAGGPAIGFSSVNSQMYSDESITMGYVSTDFAVQNADTTPVTAVFAPLDKWPVMVMWDPETYPEVADIEDLSRQVADNGGAWRYFAGNAYMAYLQASGQIADESILDDSYDGTPANFVADGGKSVQQGFASAEPYIYENEVADWSKPVDYMLIDDAGWKSYAAAMSVRSDDLEELSGCLTELVPVLQQAEVDYFADPTAANDLILDLVEQYDTGWTYSEGVADYATQTLLGDSLVSNGTNDTLGDFDDERMSTFFDLAKDVYTGVGTDVPSDLTVDSIYTNEFIDPAIGLQ